MQHHMFQEQVLWTLQLEAQFDTAKTAMISAQHARVRNLYAALEKSALLPSLLKIIFSVNLVPRFGHSIDVSQY